MAIDGQGERTPAGAGDTPDEGIGWRGADEVVAGPPAEDDGDRRSDYRPWKPMPITTSRDRLTAVLAAMADALVIYDADGRTVEATGSLAAVLGFGGDSAVAQLPQAERDQRMLPRTPEGHPLTGVEWPVARILAGEELTGERAVDLVVTARDGRALYVNAAGGPLRDDRGRIDGAVVALRDVSEPRRLERELATRAAELESIFATQAEGVAFADPSGHVLRMNDAQRRLLAARGADPATEQIDEWVRQAPLYDETGRPVPREQLPFYRALRGEALVGERAVELNQHGVDGREMTLHISAAPVRDGEGSIVGAVLTTDDISGQHRLERQRVDVMRVVAHDLANPIAAIQLYVQTQRRRLAQGKQVFTPDDELLGSMEHALARVQRLLDDLRVTTSLEMGAFALRRRRCDLAEMCQREAAAQQAATGREVHVQTPTAPVWAEVDGERLGQVLANLLTNALKFSPADRPVVVELTVGAGADRGSDGVGGRGEAAATAGTAYIRVRDEGAGIPETEQERVFEQFHRSPGVAAQDGSTGLGLGLYISKSIVERHSGTIGVESELGRGSTFWVALPMGL